MFNDSGIARCPFVLEKYVVTEVTDPDRIRNLEEWLKKWGEPLVIPHEGHYEKCGDKWFFKMLESAFIRSRRQK
jgi:hypothetical protein